MDGQALIKSAEQLHADTKAMMANQARHTTDDMSEIYNSLRAELKRQAPDNAVIAGLPELKLVMKPEEFLALAGQLLAAAQALPPIFPDAAIG